MDVLIVGAGPSGLAMACALTSHGVSCRVIDKRAGRSHESRALGIQARTLEIFQQFDLADEMLARGHRLHGGVLYSHQRPIARANFSAIKSPYPFVLSLPQSETEAILERHLGEVGVKLERGVELTSLSVTHASAVATFGDGQRVEARWVIGCDGASSSVRSLLGIPFAGRSFKETFLLADVRGLSHLDRASVHIFLSEAGVLVAIPLPQGVWRLVTNHGPNDFAHTEVTLDDVRREVAERAPGAISTDDVFWVSRFRIHRRIVNSMRQGPCFLVGDAAHIHSPVGGQGMNTGIQDGYNLAWKLALVDRGLARQELLDSYHAERHPVARSILRTTTAATRLANLRSPVTRGLRNLGATLLGRTRLPDAILPPIVAEISVNYRRGPLSVDAGLRKRTSRAGDRAPDIRFGGAPNERRSLLDLLRPSEFTLLLMCRDVPEEAEAVIRAIQGRWARVPLRIVVAARSMGRDQARSFEIVEDNDRDLPRGLGVGVEGVILIRPDGYIGYRADSLDPDALIRYLESLFV